MRAHVTHPRFEEGGDRDDNLGSNTGRERATSKEPVKTLPHIAIENLGAIEEERRGVNVSTRLPRSQDGGAPLAGGELAAHEDELPAKPTHEGQSTVTN